MPGTGIFPPRIFSHLEELLLTTNLAAIRSWWLFDLSLLYLPLVLSATAQTKIIAS